MHLSCLFVIILILYLSLFFIAKIQLNIKNSKSVQNFCHVYHKHIHILASHYIGPLSEVKLIYAYSIAME